jgi:integrase
MNQTFKCYLGHLVDREALSLSRDEAVALKNHLAASVSPKTANTVLTLISTMYNRATESGLIDGAYNPVRAMPKFKLEQRGRMLEVDELPKFFKALSSLKNELLRDFFLACVLTGEQKGKVLEMRWADVDLERGVWFIPQRKRAPRTLYLLPEMIIILKRRRDYSIRQWVFESTCSHQKCSARCKLSQSGHLESPEKSWLALIKGSGIKNLRMNDLRNSRQNIEPVRLAMALHYYAAPPRLSPEIVERQRTRAREREIRRIEQERRAAVALAIAAPIERPSMPPQLALSPVGSGSTAPTFGQLFNYYMEHHGNARKTAQPMRGYFKRHLSCFADRPVDTIQPSDVLQLHSFIGAQIGQPSANRTLEIINAVFNKAIKWQLIDIRNPCLSVDRFQLESRDRFLTKEENKRLETALAVCGSDSFVAFIQSCRFTGARSGNVAAMRWDQIDTEAKTWRIPRTKNGKPHVIPLLPEAIEAIETQRGKDPTWVFPGRGSEGHIVNPHRSWERLVKLAGLENVRKHDLRRNLGSWQAKTGASMPIISKTLGHSNPRATAVYARLDVEPIRESMKVATRAMQGLAVQSPASLLFDPQQLALLADALAGKVAERLHRESASQE